MTLSTHVLDLAAGTPASGVEVTYERFDGDRLGGAGGEGGWHRVADGRTDADGRISGLAPDGLASGQHRLTFGTGAYFAARGVPSFHPEVSVTFEVAEPGDHHHVPLLVSPFGYTTYRGS